MTICNLGNIFNTSKQNTNLLVKFDVKFKKEGNENSTN